MEGKIMDCRELGTILKDQVKDYVEQSVNMGIPKPKLVVIQVGDIDASNKYVGNKEKACEYCGIESQVFKLNPETTTNESLVQLIQYLNEDKNVHGILVQSPLPEHINPQVVQWIAPIKDVDCFTASNVGVLSIDMMKSMMMPCTAGGIYQLLKYKLDDIAGKHCVVVGRSNIVGKPMASILTQMDATVTVCHSKTKNLASHLLNADIIISAVGKAKFINRYMVKEGAVIIDVGMNRDEDGKLCGDVDVTDELLEKVEWITPVPYGVGQLTVASLMVNLMVTHSTQTQEYHEAIQKQMAELAQQQQEETLEDVGVIPPSDEISDEAVVNAVEVDVVDDTIEPESDELTPDDTPIFEPETESTEEEVEEDREEN